MLADLGESISVISLYDGKAGSTTLVKIIWRGREYLIEKIGLHHLFWKGRILVHVFSVVSGENYLKLRFETDSLRWFIDSFGSV